MGRERSNMKTVNQVVAFSIKHSQGKRQKMHEIEKYLQLNIVTLRKHLYECDSV